MVFTQSTGTFQRPSDAHIRLLSLVNTLPTRCDLNTSEGMCIIRGSRVVTVVHNGIEI